MEPKRNKSTSGGNPERPRRAKTEKPKELESPSNIRTRQASKRAEAAKTDPVAGPVRGKRNRISSPTSQQFASQDSATSFSSPQHFTESKKDAAVEHNRAPEVIDLSHWNQSSTQEILPAKLWQSAQEKAQSMDMSLRDVTGDGNCFFRCASLWIFKTQEIAPIIREMVADFLSTEEGLEISRNELEYNNKRLRSHAHLHDETIQQLRDFSKNSAIFANLLHMSATSCVFGCPLSVHIYSTTGYEQIQEFNPKGPQILTFRNHLEWVRKFDMTITLPDQFPRLRIALIVEHCLLFVHKPSSHLNQGRP